MKYINNTEKRIKIIEELVTKYNYENIYDMGIGNGKLYKYFKNTLNFIIYETDSKKIKKNKNISVVNLDFYMLDLNDIKENSIFNIIIFKNTKLIKLTKLINKILKKIKNGVIMVQNIEKTKNTILFTNRKGIIYDYRDL